METLIMVNGLAGASDSQLETLQYFIYHSSLERNALLAGIAVSTGYSLDLNDRIPKHLLGKVGDAILLAAVLAALYCAVWWVVAFQDTGSIWMVAKWWGFFPTILPAAMGTAFAWYFKRLIGFH